LVIFRGSKHPNPKLENEQWTQRSFCKRKFKAMGLLQKPTPLRSASQGVFFGVFLQKTLPPLILSPQLRARSIKCERATRFPHRVWVQLGRTQRRSLTSRYIHPGRVRVPARAGPEREAHSELRVRDPTRLLLAGRGMFQTGLAPFILFFLFSFLFHSFSLKKNLFLLLLLFI
jgi:hypothetical protein